MERLPSGRVTRVVDNVSHEGSTWVGCDMIAVANERETGRRCQEGVSRERGVSVSLWDRRDGQLLAAIIRADLRRILTVRYGRFLFGRSWRWNRKV